jgi:hypothetical protein
MAQLWEPVETLRQEMWEWRAEAPKTGACVVGHTTNLHSIVGTGWSSMAGVGWSTVAGCSTRMSSGSSTGPGENCSTTVGDYTAGVGSETGANGEADVERHCVSSIS